VPLNLQRAHAETAIAVRALKAAELSSKNAAQKANEERRRATVLEEELTQLRQQVRACTQRLQVVSTVFGAAHFHTCGT
jgi:hypothetical protein